MSILTYNELVALVDSGAIEGVVGVVECPAKESQWVKVME